MDTVQQLSRDEGRSLTAYRDSLALWTIGVGHLIDPSKGAAPPPEMTYPDGDITITVNCSITDEVCDALLASDIASKRAALIKALPWTADLPEVIFAVLLNMAFNLGVGGLLEFKDTLALVQKGDYSDAAIAMKQSLWASQVKGRADRLAMQMATGKWV